ncbi:hypothetical protein RAS2_29060 [Phycisphaerae bacterium RAS2]|nr:hypothetical protein RAS2_29060 [Phycisphaerae bacterium RAS2]
MNMPEGSKRDLDTACKTAGGIECRSCGCRHFWVIYVDKSKPNVIVRRRECRNCSRRVTTREIAI